MTIWTEYKLGDIVDDVAMGPFGSNLKVDNFIPYGVPVIRGMNLNIGGFDEKNFVFVSEEKAKSLKRSLAYPDDLVFTHRGTIGQVGIIPKEGKFPYYLVSQSQMRLTVNKNYLNPKYLLYWFKSSIGKYELLKNSAQVGVPSIASPTKSLKEIDIKVPNLRTQTTIAEILSSLDDKIELNSQINQNLEALAQAIFTRWFVDFEFPDENGQPYKSSRGEMVESELGEIPKGWSVGVLQDLIEFSNGYAFKSNELLNDDNGSCFSVFKMGHIKKGGGFQTEGTKSYFPKAKSKNLDRYILKKGDLLMCMTDMKGNVALLGHTALMNEDDRFLVNQRVGLLRPRNQIEISYPYLYILTNHPTFINDLRSRANSGVQVNLSTSEIKNSKIILPEIKINSIFNTTVEIMFEKVFSLQWENQFLKRLRDMLLPKLISGELPINQGQKILQET